MVIQRVVKFSWFKCNPHEAGFTFCLGLGDSKAAHVKNNISNFDINLLFY